MSFAREMLQTHPGPQVTGDALIACIEACFDCEQACSACADACLGEASVVEMTRCIRQNLDCADVCGTTGRILSRQTPFEPAMARAILQACAESCRICGDECEQHGQHGMDHCRVCADACRRCEQACNDLIGQLAA